MVGDADQSIYAFRGATIRNILEFEQDYPNARTILLEQNYRSTQTILSAANAVIDRNTERKPKRLWTDAGDGRADRRLRRRQRARRGRLRGPEHRRAARRRRGPARRRRRVLPHQRAVPGVRGGVHPGRPALQGGRRRALLRAQGGPRRAGLPAGDRQPRRHRVAAAHPQHPASRHRRPGRGVVEALPSASGSRSARRCAVRPPRNQVGGTAARSVNAIAGFVRLLDDLRTLVEAGTGPATLLEAVLEQTGYALELAAPHDPQDERAWRTCASWRPSPASSRTPTPRGRLADFLEQVSLVADADEIPDDQGDGVVTLMTLHTAEGPGVPGGVPHRARGRRVPAHALAGRHHGARGGAPAGLRRASPAPASGSTCPAPSALGVGLTPWNPAVALPRGDPGELLDWQREESSVTATPAIARVAARPNVASPGNRPVIALVPGDRVTHDTFGARHGGLGRTASLNGPTPPSTSAPTASSACCCATRRWRSSERSPTVSRRGGAARRSGRPLCR